MPNIILQEVSMNTRSIVRRAALCAAVAAAMALPAMPGAAFEVQNWEVGAGLGLIDPDGERNIDSDPAGLLTFGARIDRIWGAEVAAMFGNDISVLAGRGLYHFNELPGAWTPFVSAGLGITDPKPGSNDTTGLVGVGVKHPFNENLGLRAELNAHQGFDTGATDWSAFVGVTWSWGGTGSGARTTAAAATTAAATQSAAPADADRDGVPDSMDSCPGTPTGARVGSNGCVPDGDADRDGIADSKDSCPGTPAGTQVDGTGCTVAAAAPADSDGDGVADASDNCPGTPAGSKVSTDGCEVVTSAVKDSDGDGVPDDADQCSATPSGAKVDAQGCTMKLTEKVGITLSLGFDTDKADIKPDMSGEIEKVAAFMRQYPGTRVVIEGHTDNTGNSDYNQALSQRRADAVAQSLVRDHGIGADRVSAVGYGDSRPVASNDTPAGRAQNRRVEAAIEETVTR
jgi:OOP family OmpA-OmpF porin